MKDAYDSKTLDWLSDQLEKCMMEPQCFHETEISTPVNSPEDEVAIIEIQLELF